MLKGVMSREHGEEENMTGCLLDVNNLMIQPFNLPALGPYAIKVRMKAAGTCGVDVHYLKALEQAIGKNTLAYVGTGSGKTMISIMLLCSYSHLIRKPSRFFAVVLVPQVVLVTQGVSDNKISSLLESLLEYRFRGFRGIKPSAPALPLSAPPPPPSSAPTPPPPAAGIRDIFMRPYFSIKNFIKRSKEVRNVSDPRDERLLDWEYEGAVTEVKNQGNYPTCFAFSVSATIESIYKIRHGKLINLSAQQLVDCNPFYSGIKDADGNIDGGQLFHAYEVVKAFGIIESRWYPYRGIKGRCSFGRRGSFWWDSDFPKVDIDDYHYIDCWNEENLLRVILEQPVTIGIAIGPDFAMCIKNDVYEGHPESRHPRWVPDPRLGESLHSFEAMGLGVIDGKFYIRCKNSWGCSWGDDGYVNIRYGDGYNWIIRTAFYPVIKRGQVRIRSPITWK